MIEVKAELRMVKRVRINSSASLSPMFDDNDIHMVFAVTDGPEAWIDRRVSVRLGISKLVERLPVDVANRLRDELNDQIK